ncbi:MAG: response regulator, partial [Opitutales bacterium]
FVVLRVSDTGTGIEEGIRQKVFEPFFTTKAAGVGTGLGLATVQGIAYQHKGWVELDTEVGRGSTFFIFLPAADDIPAGPETPTAEQLRHPGSETILVVEDELQVRASIGRLLRGLGYQVIEAGTGTEALEKWKRQAAGVDLLFTDQVMPGGLTGLELAARLQREKPGLPVIIASGYSAELAAAQGQKKRSYLYLPKPIAAGALAAAIRKVLDEKGA